jgi:cytochrome oxidase Cu insertion factor (SCO1/SenC/PrrC family)
MNRLLVAAVGVCLATVATAGQQAQTPPPAQTPRPPVETKLKVGEMAPEFSLPGTDGKTHKLTDYKGKTVVLAWFPAAFTGG